jgi:hypothetical protein
MATRPSRRPGAATALMMMQRTRAHPHCGLRIGLRGLENPPLSEVLRLAASRLFIGGRLWLPALLTSIGLMYACFIFNLWSSFFLVPFLVCLVTLLPLACFWTVSLAPVYLYFFSRRILWCWMMVMTMRDPAAVASAYGVASWLIRDD